MKGVLRATCFVFRNDVSAFPRHAARNTKHALTLRQRRAAGHARLPAGLGARAAGGAGHVAVGVNLRRLHRLPLWVRAGRGRAARRWRERAGFGLKEQRVAPQHRHDSSVRRLLGSDSSVRGFFEGANRVIPGYLHQQVKSDLGSLWGWLPDGAMLHDENAYRDEQRINGGGLLQLARSPA
jgi:hypothetical protein